MWSGQGGETFLEKVCRILHEEEFSGDVFTWSCRQFGVKDPSELYLRDGEEKAAEEIQAPSGSKTDGSEQGP